MTNTEWERPSYCWLHMTTQMSSKYCWLMAQIRTWSMKHPGAPL